MRKPGVATTHSVWQDLATNAAIGLGGSRVTTRSMLRTFLTLRYQAAFLLRIAQTVGRYSAGAAGFVKQLNQLLTGADIAWQAQIGPGLVLFHPVGVVIGPGAQIGTDLQVQQGVTVGGDGVTHEGPYLSPRIGNRVVLGAGARVIGAVTIHDDCIVAANAVVTKPSSLSGQVAVGIPATWRARSGEASRL